MTSLLWVEEKYRLLAGQVRARYGRAALPLVTITDDTLVVFVSIGTKNIIR
jgi:hypothetical protein